MELTPSARWCRMRGDKEIPVAKKSLGNTVLGWFVVREEEEGDAPAQAENEEESAELDPEKEPERVIAKYAAKTKNAPPPPPPEESAPPSIRLPGDVPQVPAGTIPDATVFAQVFDAA